MAFSESFVTFNLLSVSKRVFALSGRLSSGWCLRITFSRELTAAWLILKFNDHSIRSYLRLPIPSGMWLNSEQLSEFIDESTSERSASDSEFAAFTKRLLLLLHRWRLPHSALPPRLHLSLLCKYITKINKRVRSSSHHSPLVKNNSDLISKSQNWFRLPYPFSFIFDMWIISVLWKLIDLYYF